MHQYQASAFLILCSEVNPIHLVHCYTTKQSENVSVVTRNMLMKELFSSMLCKHLFGEFKVAELPALHYGKPSMACRCERLSDLAVLCSR